ncbi:radical SAM protein [Methyloglobulus sp.]|uniref:radical SAM protein n=1 Tax=Methyloglobulus sp. TaxID=2518622 RepID=UPI00398A4912
MTLSLTTTNHDRHVAGLKYVYPVLSRRAGGLSIGINFNTNNACNWRCIYCQVPGLIKGAAPDLDLRLLEEELKFFLNDVRQGDFYRRFQVDAENRVIKDIAISGNGEPTSVKDFAKAVALIGEIATVFGVFPGSRFVLITNGSLIHQQKVREGLKALHSLGGEVWFKLDSATKEGRSLFNVTNQSVKSSLRNLRISSEVCTTKLQTCLIDYAGQGWSETEKKAYLDALKTIRATADVNEIMLYTLARPSMQPEASQLAAFSPDVLDAFAEDIRQLGFKVSVAG